MRYHELVESSRSAPLFHFMDERKAFDVFANDAMPGRWKHRIPGMGEVMGNSFTRNKSFKFHARPVRLVMNQARLAQRYKMVPLDGELIFRHTNQWAPRDGHRDRMMNRKSQPLAEEFVVGDIQPLHVFIDRIELTNGNAYMSGADTLELHDVATAYSKKWGVALAVSEQYVRDMEDIRRRWAEYEEEDQ